MKIKNIIILIIASMTLIICFLVFERFAGKKEIIISQKKVKHIIPQRETKEEARYLRYLRSSLDSLHHIMPNPLSGEWLAERKETGQSYFDYKKINPISKTDKRYKLYIQPVGSFTPEGNSIIILSATYLSLFYNLPVEILDSISIEQIPDSMHRYRPDFHQINASYILNNILEPNLPKDAAGYLAFSSLDLYPSENRNFVFGLGSTNKRVGVCSFFRFGDPEIDHEEFKRCLLRTIKVASHELGHMFSMKHCIEYECLMNGSNSLEESDSKPFYLCPIDLMKTCSSMEIDEGFRFQKLASFWMQNGFIKEASFCIESKKLLELNVNRK